MEFLIGWSDSFLLLNSLAVLTFILSLYIYIFSSLLFLLTYLLTYLSVSGKPLCGDDLEADKQLKTQIMRYHIQRSFKNQTTSNASDAGDGTGAALEAKGRGGGGGGDPFDVLEEASALLGDSSSSSAAAAASASAAPNALEDDLYDF